MKNRFCASDSTGRNRTAFSMEEETINSLARKSICIPQKEFGSLFYLLSGSGERAGSWRENGYRMNWSPWKGCEKTLRVAGVRTGVRFRRDSRSAETSRLAQIVQPITVIIANKSPHDSIIIQTSFSRTAASYRCSPLSGIPFSLRSVDLEGPFPGEASLCPWNQPPGGLDPRFSKSER